MLRNIVNSLFGRRSRRARRSFRIDAAEHQTEALEARTVLSALSIVADLDGVPGMELASMENNRLVIRSAVGLPERTYNVGAVNRIHAADLDGRPGSELLLTSLHTIGTQIQQSRASVVSYVENSLQTYDVGRSNALEIRDLDGFGGSEVVFTGFYSFNSLRRPSTAYIVNQSKKAVQSYDVDKSNRLTYAEVDGIAGEELVFTNLHIINDVEQRAHAIVISAVSGRSDSYDVGEPGTFEIRDVDGLPGDEIVFTDLRSINSIPLPAQMTILKQAARKVETYNVGSPNRMWFMDLDGKPGDEVLYTNLRSINGNSLPAVATVVSAANSSLREYSLGAVGTIDFADLDGAGGTEVVFSNISDQSRTWPYSRVSILNQSRNELRTLKVAPSTRLDILDLDGVPGSELLFANIPRSDEVARSSTVTVISPAGNTTNVYEVARARKLDIVNEGLESGPRVVLTNVYKINGVAQPAMTTIINPRSKTMAILDVGAPQMLSFAELDGQPGTEIVFSNVRTVNGVPMPATATVVNTDRMLKTDYQLGKAYSLELRELDGTPGVELCVRTDSQIAIFDIERSTPTYYAVPRDWLTMSFSELDGYSGLEILFTTRSGFRILNHRLKRFV